MSEINELHNKAMDFAELALIQRLQGNGKEAQDLVRQALEFERAAIQALEEPIEPTFSVLHRSAGSLALQCGELRLAEQLASYALAQEPPFEIAEELRDLVEQVNFQRHLQLKGVELGPDEVQMSLSGREVGFGMVNSVEFVGRVGDASRLIGRIADRQRRSPFSEHGPKKITRESFPLLVSLPRAASFAVTLRVGRPTGQQHLPSEAQEIVDEFLDVMEILESSADLRVLQERIPEAPYLRNFLGLVKKIAPDGDRVQQVGFTVRRGNRERRVSVMKPAARMPLPSSVELPAEIKKPSKSVEFRGTLRFADAIGDDSSKIKIVDSHGKSHSVIVPLGMMNDIVRPMWDSEVVIRGIKRGRATELQEIDLAD